jgi:metal-responsive CopG/Arc/MetJ family transcriptional regulator
VPRAKGPNDTQVSVNLPGQWAEELDELARVMSEEGLGLTRSDVMRLAVRKGLDALKKERDRKGR